MAVVKVNVVDAQSPQRLVTSFLNVFRLIAYATLTSLGVHIVGELGCKEDVLTLARISLEPISQQIFRVLVHVCTVPVELSSLIDVVEHGKSLFIWFGLSVKCR